MTPLSRRPETEDRYSDLRDNLKRASHGSLKAVFGADHHQWRFLPPLSPSVVDDFERQQRVTLPTDYREFLVTVSAGGAGPAYGLLPLEMSMAVDGPGHDLAKEFPWTAAHNPHTGGPDPDDEIFNEQVAGTLALCHEGCGYYHRLVVSGPSRGTMWMDGRCSDQGFAPLNVDFPTWYRRWIDGVLAGGDGLWWMTRP